MKNVDVIIPTYHPGKDFYQLLKRLDQQTRPIHRILVNEYRRKRAGSRNGKRSSASCRFTIFKSLTLIMGGHQEKGGRAVFG